MTNARNGEVSQRGKFVGYTIPRLAASEESD